MKTNKTNIEASKIQLNIFIFLLGLIWLVAGIFAGIQANFKYSLIVWFIGISFLLVLKNVQKYFIKMLVNYNNNLKKVKGGE